jgi:dienelactone hydrolase
MNIYNKKLKRVWEAKGDEKPINYVFSQGTQLLAFMVQGDRGNSIWYCSEFNDKAIELAKQGLDSISKDLFLSGINYRGFTNNGRKIFIELKEKKKSVNPGVDIWSYNDVRLQSQQLKQLKAKTFLGVISIPDNKLIRLEEKDDKVISFGNDLAIIANIKGDLSYDEWYWNKSATSSVCLVSMNDGTKKIIADSLPAVLATSYWLSPESKYVIYYDALEKSYFSYEVSSGIKRNITKGVNTEWTKYDKRDIWMGKYMPVYCASAGWLNGDRAVLLYDQWDIYQVDPSGKTFPINLTNGYGKVNNIEFRLAFENNQTFIGNEALYLSAFNRVNKNDGFFKVRLGQSEKPQLLTSDAVVYKGTWEDERFPPVYPIKAKQVEIYVVRRMTAKDPPNYFWTTDFKSFTAITDLHPEKEFNWLTAELVNWKTPNGEQCQGILYKPEDFNPNKKYPIIFHYYERVTEAKNAFLYPAFTHGELNIPYYVSNGYLVFTPDIHYVQGHPGNSVLNTVTSAARYLSQLPYIDSKHIGLQGHSRGGWETNFIITHTNIFAAAMSASGFCDYVTLYNQIRSLSSGISRQPAYEISYQRIGATLWEKPELFIENSPIFFVNKVTTPLLMMNNKADSDVPFEQGVEFFCALRRLGKKAWMLQYDDEDHLVFDKASEDLTIRMKQFFDYYLKGEPPPEWMVNGIPAINKGTDRGFKVVPGENPRNGLVRD